MCGKISLLLIPFSGFAQNGVSIEKPLSNLQIQIKTVWHTRKKKKPSLYESNVITFNLEIPMNT